MFIIKNQIANESNYDGSIDKYVSYKARKVKF